jgi:5'-nucleotidase
MTQPEEIGVSAPPTDPLAEAARLLSEAGFSFEIEGTSQVYVNRDLRLGSIEWVGFDMDYTLALYEQIELDALSVRHTVDSLIGVHGYPESIREIRPDPDFAIRGLVIDKQRGNILKMDSHRYVGRVFHGLSPAPPEVKRAYQDQPIKMQQERFVLVDTLFSLPETFLYAALIDHLEKRGVPSIDFVKLYDDVRAAIDLAHADGRIKRDILADVPRYVLRDPALGPTLHKLRSAGKRLFLLTNSESYYTNAVMSYLLEGDDGEALSHGYRSWEQYFDVIVTSACKPRFFRGGAPFVKVGADGRPAGEEHVRLERGRIYENGNVADFERMLGVRPSTILYVGDHIYGDIVRSKRDSSWRTAMIIQEMELELQRRGLLVNEIRRWAELDQRLASLNSDLAARQDALAQLEHAYGDSVPDRPATDEALTRIRAQLESSVHQLVKMRRQVVAQLIELDEEVSRNFNPYWGLLFKEGAEHSVFGGQVETYACLYTSRVSNLRRYSPMQYFRARRQLMPHEA